MPLQPSDRRDASPSGHAARPGTALYVHFPYCVVKCTYCDFYSVPVERPNGAREDVDGALDGLLAEARLRAPLAPRTVFLGGGTPSLPSAEQIGRFLDELDSICGFRASAVEVTAECNPESLDAAKAAALLAGGVTRLSVGVQSLQQSVLELFGRAHDAEQGLRALAAAREGGATRLSADLIYAAPGLTAAQWEADLERVVAAAGGLEHLSAYNLTFEEGTRLEMLRRRGDLAPLDEDTELAMFEATARIAAAAGMERYEVSNYARPGEACEHNLVYWANGEYVGIGPSAVSKVGNARFGNVRSVDAWLRAVQRATACEIDAGAIADWSEEPSALARLGETWWLGLRRTIGVDPAEARATAGFDDGAAPDPAVPIAERMVGHGLLALVDGRYRLTERGRPLADGVAKEFLALDPQPPRD
ncbi:Oxygen-independent coproporphyrinogen-III oxidase-like protein [Planctomycetes bacterium Pla163]|uniref:Heme chaperone HemW n=1 Tax=Rohdeia mirabilis TaxID=2528008 RepID=A0A518D580_9BACT|nr:Oxygen-independent coproporphyrinogen-III oxidase-like protein [Planctomycetes bacterium Pla163]